VKVCPTQLLPLPTFVSNKPQGLNCFEIFPPAPLRRDSPPNSLYAGSEQYDHVFLMRNVVGGVAAGLQIARTKRSRCMHVFSTTPSFHSVAAGYRSRRRNGPHACAFSKQPLTSHGVDIAVIMMIGRLLFVPLLQGSLNGRRLGPRRQQGRVLTLLRIGRAGAKHAHAGR
jgi:hypothetical protein